MEKADVVIIGAGIVGLASAYWLTKSGTKVIVLDKGRAGWEASGRATGFHSLRGEIPAERPLAALAEELWKTMDEELGYPTEWVPGGRLWVALEQDRWAELMDICPLWRSGGLPIEVLDGAGARAVVPCLSEQTLGGLYMQRSGHLNPQRATQAFAWALRDRGGEIREETAVVGITVSGGRVTGVETTTGPIAAPIVITCAGPQSAKIAAMVGIDLPLATVRLEAMVTVPLPRLFDVAMVGHGISLRQTRRGNIHFNGGPHEWVDVDLTAEPAKPTTPIIRNIGRRLAELFPSLAQTPVLRSWAGVIDVTPDQMCLIDRVQNPDGMIFVTAAGHGVGLAPSIGQVVCALARGETTPVPVDGLGLARFAALDPDWREKRRWTAGNYNT